MRVAYILGAFPLLSEQFVHREIAAVRALGIDVRIFALRRPRPNDTDADVGDLNAVTQYRRRLRDPRLLFSQLYWLCRRPATYIHLYVAALSRYRHHLHDKMAVLRNLPAAADFARDAGRAIDHVHAHFAYVPADVGHAVAALLGVPFTLSAHAWDIYSRPRECVGARLRLADTVVTCTEHGRRTVAEMVPEVSSECLRTVRHGLALGDFVPQDVKEPIIVAVGRLVEKKGFDRLVEACRLLKMRDVEFRCNIIGEGPLGPALRALVWRLDLGDHVWMPGSMSWPQLIEHVAHAAILVAPSVVAADGDRDGLPNVVLEAMAAGRPVIASRDSAASEAIVDGQTGFIVSTDDATDLADRIELLLGDAARRESMGRDGRSAIERDFDINNTSREMVDVFTKAARQ